MGAASPSTFLAESAAEFEPVLTAVGLRAAPSVSTREIVLDSFDGRLAAAGLRLLATADGGGVGVRLVLTGDTTAAHATVGAMPRSCDDLPAGPLRQRLARLLDIRVLIALHELRATRVVWTTRNASDKTTAVVTVAADVSVGGSGRAQPGAYAEVIELTGYTAAAATVRDALAGAGFDGVSGTIADVTAAAADVSLRGTVIEAAVPLDTETSAIDAFKAVFANLAATAALTYDGAAAALDPEFLHDLRVAVRRTRAILSNAKRVLPADIRRKAAVDFRQLGRLTGPVRDLDVYQLEWPSYVAGLDAETVAALEPVRERFAADQAEAHESLAAEFADPATRGILEWWSAWLVADDPHASSEPAKDADRPIRVVAARQIRSAHATLIERGGAIDAQSPATDLHELRKDAKQLRYLLECFGGIYPKHLLKPFVSSLKQLQENLGEFQDAEVHAAALGGVAARLGTAVPLATTLSVGRLIERLEQRRTACRAEFAGRFGAFDDDATRSALDELLAKQPKVAR